MPAADSAGPDDAPKFRSPKRALARSFRLSRDRWKNKANQRRQQIKALKIRIRDLEVSRDLWKEKALHLQRQQEELLGVASSLQEEDPTIAVQTARLAPDVVAPEQPRPGAPDAVLKPPLARGPAPATPPPGHAEAAPKKKRRVRC
jgi:hypothetical protein